MRPIYRLTHLVRARRAAVSASFPAWPSRLHRDRFLLFCITQYQILEQNLGISYLWVCGFFEIILESSGIQGNSDLLAYLEIPYANFQNILDFHQIPKSFWNQLIVLAISWFMGLVRWIPYNVKSTDFWKKNCSAVCFSSSAAPKIKISWYPFQLSNLASLDFSSSLRLRSWWIVFLFLLIQTQR